MIKKLAVVLLTIVMFGMGAGWYLWQKNAQVINQLEEMEKSFLEDAQNMPLESGDSQGKANGKPGAPPGIPGQGRKSTSNNSNPVNKSGLPEKKDASSQEKGKPTSVPEKIDMSDRAEVMAIVSSRLTSGDIKRLQGLAQGGFTPEEKREAKAIVRARLSGDEIERLKAISRKYR